MRTGRGRWTMVVFLLLLGTFAQAGDVVVEVAPPSPAFPQYSTRQLLLFALTVESSVTSFSYCDAGPRKSFQEQEQELRRQYETTACSALVPFRSLPVPPNPEKFSERAASLLAAIAAAQSPDGSWQQNREVTAWCMLALLDSGNSIKIGLYRKVLQRAQSWVLARMEAEGGVYGTSVYENMLGVRVLATSLMMADLRAQRLPQLSVAGARLLARQNPDGSWGERQALEWDSSGRLVWRNDHARRLPLTALAAETVALLRICEALQRELTDESSARAARFARTATSPCGVMCDPAGVPAPLFSAAAFLALQVCNNNAVPTGQEIAEAVFLHACTEEYLNTRPEDGAFYAFFSSYGLFRLFRENSYLFQAVSRRGLQYLYRLCFPDGSEIPAPRETPVDLPGR